MSIKIVHTSDWHLGKKLYKKERIQEQEMFLSWLYEYILKNQIDVLLIAGDIFDVPTPPNVALNAYYTFLEKVSANTQTTIALISGNHDSSAFLKAPAKLLNKFNIKVFSEFSKDKGKNTFVFEKHGQSLEVKSIPYFRSYDLNKEIDKSSLDVTKEDYLELLKETSSSWNSEDSFKIIQSHHAFGEFLASESEHVLNLAGLESIPLSILSDNADYVALGHIHKAQRLSKDKEINYCGSPIPLRFSEVHQKIIKEITLDNTVTVKDIEIPSFRNLYRIRTKPQSYKKDLEKIIKNELTNWIEIQLELQEPNSQIVDDIKSELEKTNSELISFYPIYSSQEDQEQESSIELVNMSISEIFDSYYQIKYPDSKETPQALRAKFHELLEGGRDED